MATKRRRIAHAIQNGDLYGGQLSNGTKCSKVCSMASKHGQMITDDDDDLHRGQRSTEVLFDRQMLRSNVVYNTGICPTFMIFGEWWGLGPKVHASIHFGCGINYIKGILHEFFNGNTFPNIAYPILYAYGVRRLV